MKTEQRPPRDNLFRAIFPGVELRSDGDGDAPVMAGHFAVFNQWTEINSIFEGNFMERFAPGAFKKTLSENRKSMRALFQHGFDPVVGDKPLGPIRELREDKEGAYYEVPLLDASYVRDLVLPGLREGLYGASFRFRVILEEVNEEPKRSAHNPEGLPERTVKEAEVREFGPVTFPAYEGATAGVRSLSDEFLLGRFAQEPERLKGLIAFGTRSTPSEEEASREEEPEAPEEEPITHGSDLGEEEPGEAAPAEEEAGEAPEADDEVSAPPDDDAEAEPHVAEEGRAKREPIYGVPKTETPTWRL